jgi:hypothetical protein
MVDSEPLRRLAAARAVLEADPFDESPDVSGVEAEVNSWVSVTCR